VCWLSSSSASANCSKSPRLVLLGLLAGFESSSNSSSGLFGAGKTGSVNWYKAPELKDKTEITSIRARIRVVKMPYPGYGKIFKFLSDFQ